MYNGHGPDYVHEYMGKVLELGRPGSGFAQRELRGVEQLRTDHENLAQYVIEETTAYRMLEISLGFDFLREEGCDESESVEHGDLELEGPADDGDSIRVGRCLEPCGDER